MMTFVHVFESATAQDSNSVSHTWWRLQSAQDYYTRTADHLYSKRLRWMLSLCANPDYSSSDGQTSWPLDLSDDFCEPLFQGGVWRKCEGVHSSQCFIQQEFQVGESELCQQPLLRPGRDKNMESLRRWTREEYSLDKVRCPWTIGTADNGDQTLDQRDYHKLYSRKTQTNRWPNPCNWGQEGSSACLDGSSVDVDAANSCRLFTCPEEGCVRTFVWHSSLVKHLDCGKHNRAVKYETLCDKAMIEYATNLEYGTSKCPIILEESRPSLPTVPTTLPMGWALKSTQFLSYSGSSKQVSLSMSGTGVESKFY